MKVVQTVFAFIDSRVVPAALTLTASFVFALVVLWALGFENLSLLMLAGALLCATVFVIAIWVGAVCMFLIEVLDRSKR